MQQKRFIISLWALLMIGIIILPGCEVEDNPSPEVKTAEFFIKADVNGEEKFFQSKTGFSLLVPANPAPVLILRANEGYSKLWDVPGFELHISFPSFPPAPGVYSKDFSDDNFIQFNFLEQGEVKKARSGMKGTDSRIVLREVIPYEGGYILEGNFYGKVQNREGNSIWEFDLRNGQFRVFASN